MRKFFLRALLCLLAAVLALGFVRLGVEKTMPDYPDSLGDSLAPEKITGEYLLRTAAAQDDTLPVFGSSELKTTQICTHPANFFAGKRCGFQVDLIGRGSCQSLVHAMAIAASGESLTGKKAVLITAPQSYVEDGIAPDLFMANFSEQQMLTLLSDKTIPAEQRQYLARRVAELIEAYNAQYGASLQQTTAAGLLTRAAAKGQTALEVLLMPYAAISEWLLDTRDMTSSRRVIAEAPTVQNAQSSAIDWDVEEQSAVHQAEEQTAGNEFGMEDSYYNTYIGRRLAQQAGKDASVSYDSSPEYDDLRCLFAICKAKQMQILFVHVPMHGAWSDYTGFSAERRQTYYENVRHIAAEYENVTLLDLTGYEYESYFLCDTMHLGWKGWLAVDKAIAEFWEAA